ncbi:2-octaprenyl-6-methoxyphenyl hydroxylase [Cylindrospermopsis raciborskii S07]|uniref:2-octaprenyl-6-methoxyphenyl hydroxylase n=3 Tax=Cylindrospermopsis raciborskii TaxID=77022 RepID=A0A853M913_9CYAN|nr:FAD-dependent hydroxylase [Cylindrospermopsis raciborskii]EFA69627.1 Ubiquinone biosynthesis hydroxylase, UbiH/UbiF/VisC/COQ6 [Cylindrospermopsis raciborskii CS-505]MBA4446669.1 FAD-dependent hydroxylase [Cylindrospermopsis raciborskii CS-506_C]MBA4450903.1 FAD-dependent hydroxylase [Cylindrospermopsis raciborskii CS-506_D]MBA4457508.1 FAD-dependent hydroxylase [Cylindrospermopsis raciborskii CS-506_B]MBA4466881.1 FAD-dependent hydroxylase [Cylindrospermopsis raciborskii CS-506_A]
MSFSSSEVAQTPNSRLATTESHDYDLMIVGGGIVGLTLAAALKDSGLTVLLVEAQVTSTAVAKGQAYAIHMLSARIFQGIGIWGKILPHIAKYRQVFLSDAEYPNVVKFQTSDLGGETPELGYVAEHFALLEPLQEFVRTCANVTYLCPATVVSTKTSGDIVTVNIQINGADQVFRTKLMVAADGSKSPLRQAAGIKTKGWKYWQSCIVAFVRPEKSHNYTAYEKFWQSGPFAILPLPGNRCRIVWTAPHEEAKILCALSDEEFLAELTRRYGHQMGKLELLGERFVFQVQLMQSDRYVLPRLALVGDAAHNCHPVGGQGLNLGIRDAAALAEVIQTAHQQGKDIGNIQILQEYERWRKNENLAILGFTDLLDRIFSNNILPMVIIRRLGLWLMQRIPILKVFALKLMIGFQGRTPQLAQLLLNTNFHGLNNQL